jgi:putative addiction module component (TIGR02574 family)
MSVAEVRQLALELSADERALLARDLIESLDEGDSEADVEQTWREEIEARAEALARGQAHADDWKTSLDRVRGQLREGR